MHQEQLLHGDLKASNVLLSQGQAHVLLGTTCERKMDASDSSGCVAAPAGGGGPQSGSILELVEERPFRLIGKVSDFGLSLAMDADVTHVSHMHAVSVTPVERVW
jgi:serine/threonine protein kinase